MEGTARPAAGTVEPRDPVEGAGGREPRRPRVDEREDGEDGSKGPESEQRQRAPLPEPLRDRREPRPTS